MPGERVAVSRERVQRFADWVASTHPQLGRPDALDPSQLFELADEFEGGGLADNRRLFIVRGR